MEYIVEGTDENTVDIILERYDAKGRGVKKELDLATRDQNEVMDHSTCEI